jgi:transcriptional regulator with XRE-family HTH domain
MQLHMEASGPAAIEFRETLGALGLSQVHVAKLLGVRPRHLRRWRCGERRIPHGIILVMRLLTAGYITVDQLEEVAARVNGNAGPATPADPGSTTTAEKIVALLPNACRWPIGDPGADGADSHAFRFCGRPAVVGHSYCDLHRARAYRERVPFRQIQVGRKSPAVVLEIEPLDREDGEILAHARDCQAAMELTG